LVCFLFINPPKRRVFPVPASGDQKRIMTPAEAVEAGATTLVIGRPVTNPPPEISGPIKAPKRVADEIASASA
jgi:orotidine-5'-phosphate decarboxylase